MIAFTVLQLQNTRQREASERWIVSVTWEDDPPPPRPPQQKKPREGLWQGAKGERIGGLKPEKLLVINSEL